MLSGTVRGVASSTCRNALRRHLVAMSPPAAATAMASFSTEAQRPSVKDLIVNLTIVDPSGARKKTTGLVGKTLHHALETQGIDIGPSSSGSKPETIRTERWTEPTFGEGPTSGYDHVVLAGKGADTATPMSYSEEEQLGDYWEFDEIFEGSRLASAITLTKEMDGMTVYVPDRLADDCP